MTELIVALDVPTIKLAGEWVELLDEDVSWFKVGLELFTAEGKAVATMLKGRGKKVFLDLKFHDIPRTVARAVVRAADMGVDMINLHAVGGREMMETAAATLVDRDNPPKLIAVTVLTSMDAGALREMGIRRNPKTWVTDLALMAWNHGLDGVVASPRELKNIRKACGVGFIVVTPGIRMPDSPADDQRRTATPEQASKWGADYIVVGRPILEADNPVKAARSILRNLEK